MTVGLASLIAVILSIMLAVLWSKKIGWIRGPLAAICRLCWILPIILTLAPETITEQLPSAMVQQPIHILLDDSDSMRVGRQKTALPDIERTLFEINEVCQLSGCLPKIDRLSDLRGETKKGFTPLSAALEPWLFKIGAEPWIVLSDGADWRPSRNWDERLRNRGSNIKGRRQGLVVGFGAPASPGFWLEDVGVPSFAFEGRSISAIVKVGRAVSKGTETVQVQVAVDGSAVVSSNATFSDGSSETNVEVVFSSPAKGPHLISVKTLPVAGEKDVWDNEVNTAIDVMPNTIGVLHLLGSPSWDGRFLRRYLKSEPKFDLISFFILRDPSDSQQVGERDLSLIPFPVERLFKEELQNFRVLVIQNFTMQQFLQPEFQVNLVKFVLNGGGLLFIGGPRALTEADIANSPIGEILPISLNSSNVTQEPNLEGEGRINGSTFDSGAKFKISLSDPDIQKRSLATVYDDWQKISGRLINLQSLKGIHRVGNLKLRQDVVTPLLDARLENGQSSPLAIATYPGKGRAIWIFTDSMWKLAMDGAQDRSRFDYHDFFDAAFTWLMRNDRKPSIVAKGFRVERAESEQAVLWSVGISGPAARFVGTKGSEWKVTVCDRPVAMENVVTEQHGPEEWTLSGSVHGPSHTGGMCSFVIDGQHAAFGSVNTSALAVFSETLTDAEMSPSPRKLKQLSEITGALLVTAESRSQSVNSWVRSWTSENNQVLPNRFKTIRDFYWPHKRNWIWLVLLLLPLEVIIRRWHLLVGQNPAKRPENGD